MANEVDYFEIGSPDPEASKAFYGSLFDWTFNPDGPAASGGMDYRNITASGADQPMGEGLRMADDFHSGTRSAACGGTTTVIPFAAQQRGQSLRAAVDDQRVARGLGINVGAVFGITFAVGSGLAGLGGALGAEILGLDPTFPLKYMIYFLIVVTVGGTSSITGPFLAALLIGIGDVAGKYYAPKFGAFIIYVIMIVVLIVRPQGLFARAAGK